MKCETCEGKGFIEHEHGLIMVECSECGGTGEVGFCLGGKEEISQKDVVSLPPWKLNEEEIEALSKPVEVVDDSSSRDRPDNQPVGSETTGKHKQSRKPKARKKATKRPG